MGASAYIFSRSARSAAAIGWVAAWWAALVILYFVIDAAPVIVLLLGAISLPALFDIGAGATSTLRIDAQKIEWRSGARGAHLPRGQLKSVRLDTRLDLSLRMTLITDQGGKIRLPYECVPKANAIEKALKSYDIPYERHHFTLLS